MALHTPRRNGASSGRFIRTNAVSLREVGTKNVLFAFISAVLASDDRRFFSNSCRSVAMRCKLMVTEDGPNGEPLRPTEKVCCVRGIPAGAIFDVVDCDVIVLALVAFKAMRSRYLRSAQFAEIFLQLEALNAHLDDGQPPIPGCWRVGPV